MKTLPLLAVMLLVAGPAGLSALGAGAVEGTVPASATAPRIDGRLDDEVWREAYDIGPLTQREPREGTEPTERTRVRLVADRAALYVAVECFESDPAAIVASQMARDADLGADDNVEIVLDTYFDQRNGYYFQVNPLGARVDGLITNNADPAKEWDGIWMARVERHGDGWTAELVIPFKTLNFVPGQATWGFNVQRTIRRKQETIRWRAARQNMRLAQVSEAGALDGFGAARQGRGLDVRPYVAGGVRRDGEGRPYVGDTDIGIDVVKNLSPSVAAVGTINTDFAETEVDARQVNLTRFSLFFPEKRTFFLQNASAFNVTGLGVRPDQASQSDVLPFYSRRVGLSSAGQPIPVLAGGKIVGRVGAWSLGVLDIATRESGADPRENFFVARVARNVGRQSLVGVIATHGNPGASGGGRPLVGVDGRYATSTLFGTRNFSAEGNVMRTWRDEPGLDGLYTSVVRVEYPNDPLGINLTFKDIGSNFDPGLGFVPRRGIRKGSYNLDYYIRPNRWGIRHNRLELYTDTVHRPDGRLLNWRVFVGPSNIRTESGEHLEWNYIPEYEFLDVPFAIRPGIVVPAGGYVMHRYRAEVNTATKRRWIGDLSVRYGGFYGGTRVETTATLRYRPSNHVLLRAGLAQNDVELPQGRFRTRIWQARADVAFSPDVTVANFFQYDSVSRVAGLNTRLRWTPQPGNDLFVVLNVGLRDELDRWVSAYETVTSKLQYTWRF